METFAERIYNFFNSKIKEKFDNINSIEFAIQNYYPNKSRKNPKIRLSLEDPEIYTRLNNIQDLEITVNLDIYTNFYSDNMLKSLDIPHQLYQHLHSQRDDNTDTDIFIVMIERSDMDYYVTNDENEVVSTLSFNVVLEDHSARTVTTDVLYPDIITYLDYE